VRRERDARSLRRIAAADRRAGRYAPLMRPRSFYVLWIARLLVMGGVAIIAGVLLNILAAAGSVASVAAEVFVVVGLLMVAITIVLMLIAAINGAKGRL